MAEPARRVSLWPLLATIVGIGITVALGTWQLNRAQEKRELKARLDARSAQPPVRVPAAEVAVGEVELRRVEARGVFEPRHTIYLDNRIHHGVPGYQVVTPLRIEGSERYVLVNRGWIAAGANRARAPDVPTPAGLVTVTGTAIVPGKRILELSESVIDGPVWQNLTIERYRGARPLAIQPFVILLETALEDGLTREWPAPDVGIDKHYGYAFQWFALAATLLIFYAVTRYRRRQRA